MARTASAKPWPIAPEGWGATADDRRADVHERAQAADVVEMLVRVDHVSGQDGHARLQRQEPDAEDARQDGGVDENPVSEAPVAIRNRADDVRSGRADGPADDAS